MAQNQNEIEYIRVKIQDTTLKVFEDGKILRKMKNNYKEIVNKANQTKGYNVILIEKKQYMRSKLIAYAYLNIELDDKSVYICHKDEDKLNCSVNNLLIKNKKF